MSLTSTVTMYYYNYELSLIHSSSDINNSRYGKSFLLLVEFCYFAIVTIHFQH